MTLTLTKGTLEIADNMNGWLITSGHAIAEGAEDMDLYRGDWITIDGDVFRNGEHVGNLS